MVNDICYTLLKEAQFEAGEGENHFTMKRGSFRYRQRIRKRRKLHVVSHYDTLNGYTEELEDEDGNDYLLSVCAEHGRWKLTLNGKASRYWITFPSVKEEKIYGCGETYSKFNLKGESVRIFVAEHQNSGRITKKILREKLTGVRPEKVSRFSKYESYYAQPTYVSSRHYYLHADANNFAEFDFRKDEKTVLYFQEDPVLYLKQADTYEALSKDLGDLLGRQQRLPEWIYDGMILGIQGGFREAERKIRNMQEQDTKICGIWCQDWCGCRRTKFGYQVMWNWEADETLYPDFRNHIQSLKDRGIRFLGYINPFIALEKNLYKEASAKGYCVKDREGKDYLVTITTFPAAMIDFTNPDAYDWYKNIIKTNMIDTGMSGWMADFGEYLPTDAVLFSKEDPSHLHNSWPSVWARMNKEAIEEAGVKDEVFFFTRSGNTGTVSSSAMMWTGDQHVDWSMDDGIPSVIPATLSLAMSGYGITHSDAGGYTTILHMRRSKELLMRWLEMNVFSVLLRTHEGNQPVNNVQFDGDRELMEHTAKMSRMHASLKPYLMRSVEEEALSGTPVIRPLFYYYEEEKAYTCTDEYLLGRDVLVCPVLKKGETQREVYFPDDVWMDPYTGLQYTQGTLRFDAEIGRPLVFLRAGRDIGLLQDLEEMLKRG